MSFQKLEGWKTLPEAGEVLGVTRQDVEKRLKAGHFSQAHVRTIGGGRPIYLVSDESLAAMVANSGDVTAELLEAV